jgi:TetR/AcrR family transcriptional regulator, mexJK operon transcriptional repressor
MPARRATQARDLRRATFVSAARDLFLSQGYADTTMSAVAARVGGSKTTLWSYFPSKQDLFAAVVDDLVESIGQVLELVLVPSDAIADTLRRFANAMLVTMLSPPAVAMQRLVTGEVDRFPELGILLYVRGPGPGRAKLAHYLKAEMDRGILRAADPDVAALHFGSLCQSGCYQRHMMGLCPQPSAPDIAADVEVAIDVFLRAYTVFPTTLSGKSLPNTR